MGLFKLGLMIIFVIGLLLLFGCTIGKVIKEVDNASLLDDEILSSPNVSQQALADQIGVFRNTISNWETGYSQISLENAKKVAEYFGVTIEYLLGSESD